MALTARAPSTSPAAEVGPTTTPPARAARRALAMAAALVVVVLVAAASVAWGTRVVGWTDVGRALAATVGIGEGGTGLTAAVVEQRIPRTVLALLAGAALGLAGAVMQGVTRNPLADPGILGVTSGAALAVVVGIAFFGLSSATGYVWVAILGAGLCAALVYAVGSLGRGGATPLKLTLAGAATGAAASSLISAVLLPRMEVMNQFRFWQVGGVGGASFDKVALVLPFLGVGMVLSLAAARGLNALALGDDVAAALGERVARTRLLAAVGAVVLCGAVTAVAGPIGFVGLVVPHLCRLLIGVDHRWLLPASMVVGAALLTAADVVGRVVARPSEVDVGIVTALVGAPVFIAIVRRQKVRAL